jgi:hypothetical protein
MNMYFGIPEVPTIFLIRTADCSLDVPMVEKLLAPVPDDGIAAPVSVIVEAFGRTNDTALSYELSPPVGSEPPAVVHANATSVAP